MTKLKPLYQYRLRILAAGPRFYRPIAVNRYLEKRGLIRRTGRLLPPLGLPEYEITVAGLMVLAGTAAPTDP